MKERRMNSPKKLVVIHSKEEEQEAMSSMREKRMETPGQLVTDRRCENPITTGPGALHSTYIIQDYNTEPPSRTLLYKTCQNTHTRYPYF